jgi:hypothetical protein
LTTESLSDAPIRAVPTLDHLAALEMAFLPSV